MNALPAVQLSSAETEGGIRELERRYSNPGLSEFLPRWSEQERELDFLEMRVRYQWAKDLKQVYSSPDYYGAMAAETLLEQRMTEVDEFRIFYNVATYIDDDFFQQVEDYNANDVAKQRGHFTWEHLKVFSRLGDTAAQQSLLEQWMVEQWCVETLAAKVTAAITGQADEDQEDQSKVVGRITRAASKLTHDVSALLVDVRTESSQPATGNPLEKTRRKLARARDVVARCLYQLSSALT